MPASGAGGARQARMLLIALAAIVLAARAASAMPASPAAETPATIEGCSVFPPDNIWNARVDLLPLDPNSAAYVNTIGANLFVHGDFGSGLWAGAPIGIPYVTVAGDQPRVPVVFHWNDESDVGPYPIPANAPIEGGPNSSGDRHVIVVDRDACVLYEMYNAYPQDGASWWFAHAGAVFNLNANALRPTTWTSADAAGLPILPGLVRYDEVAAGEIAHALRFTAPQTRRAYVWPARHYASTITGSQYPAMGQRFRLKANFDISSFPPEVQVILRALKAYGMMLADNGSPWYVSGAPDERWNNDNLHELHRVPGSAFEAVDVSSLMIHVDSAQVRASPTPSRTLTRTPTATGLASATPTAAAATATRSPTATWTLPPTRTPMFTWTPSATRTEVPTWTPTATKTFAPTATTTLTRTPSETRPATPTWTPPPTRTSIPTWTPLPTRTYTPTRTPTPSRTETPSHTITPSRTLTPTRTPSLAPSPSESMTPLATMSSTPSRTPADTATETATATATPTATPSFLGVFLPIVVAVARSP